MEQHGDNPLKNVIAIIPARYASTRLPGKMLLPIGDKPLILHTIERAKSARTVDRVIVATDDERILAAVLESGNEAAMTREDHQSGSDRIAEIADALPEGSIIVNVQGDEPLISSETIDRAVEAMRIGDADIVTVSEPLTSLHGELLNFNVVKVVVAENGNALYFSRSPMPFPRDASLRHGGDPNRALDEEPELFENFRKHAGLYVYSREFLLKFTKWQQTKLEIFESLEQLRALENGAVIKLVEAAEPSIGVDTQEDLDRVRLKVEFPTITVRTGSDFDIAGVSNAYMRTVRDSYQGILPAEYLESLSAEKRHEVHESRRAAHDTYHLLVADDAEKGIVGFIDRARMRSDNFGLDAHVFSFYIVPEFQGRGLGGLLFRRCFRQLKKEGCESVGLDTFEANPYRKFYEKVGGQIIDSGEHLSKHQFPTVVYAWKDLSRI